MVDCQQHLISMVDYQERTSNRFHGCYIDSLTRPGAKQQFRLKSRFVIDVLIHVMFACDNFSKSLQSHSAIWATPTHQPRLLTTGQVVTFLEAEQSHRVILAHITLSCSNAVCSATRYAVKKVAQTKTSSHVQSETKMRKKEREEKEKKERELKYCFQNIAVKLLYKHWG